MAAGIHTLRVNGRPAGEGTINAHLAAHFSSPVVLVAGDEAALEEASSYAPSAERVLTKHALSRFTARLRPVGAVRQDLAAATERAMARLADGSIDIPARSQNLSADIEFSGENCALAATAIPGVQRTGPRSVSYSSQDVAQWYRCLGAIWTLARSAQGGIYG
jgi:D-amino peptidase